MITQTSESPIASTAQVIDQISDLKQSFAKSESGGLNLFIRHWGDKIKDFSFVVNLLDLIEYHGNAIDDSITNASNIDEWFNAYLVSDDFASMPTKHKKDAIRAKEAVRFLIECAVAFLSENELGVYGPQN